MYKSFTEFLFEAEEMDELIKSLQNNGYEVKKLSGARLAILTDKNRIDVLEKIEKEYHGNYDRTPSNASSVGMVKVGKINILAKPKSKQGRASAGIDNEMRIINTINDICKTGPINVRFTDGSKIFECIGVTHCKEMGRDTSGRKKADIILEGKEKYPISIKKDNAEIWESADTYAAEKAKSVIQKLLKDNKIVITTDSRGVSKISPTIAWKASASEKKDVMFGSDIEGHGCVIQKTFGSQLYKIATDGFYEISVSKIYKTINDASGAHDVWFLVRNDSTRKSPKLGYNGLRILAVYGSRINKNVMKV